MGIGVLRRSIGFDGDKCQGESDKFDVSASFNYVEYRKEITKMFESHQKYQVGCLDKDTDIDYEKELIKRSKNELYEIRTVDKPLKRGSRSKSAISELKLKVLLAGHSVKQTKECVLSFTQEVQELVSRLYQGAIATSIPKELSYQFLRNFLINS